ncbi:response regulator [Calothrix sp. UHCC 0171]|uniref:response regulator n=1 Tax=Calothrix sp. UHCC 0171 TaxID=3110245 RepID=UPI002B20A135|nr:response regulator [Calothrix sp. UHCC 0171]MEA5570809.1 response regulator [Calothrix sp. UHCC 0171]
MSAILLGKIAIVEDSPSQLELMSHFLDGTGYEIFKAGNAKEAVKIIFAETPDIVITDVVMPEMSGFELCRLLRKNPLTKDISIIICTSKNQKIDRLWGIRQGANIYLTKPYTRQELVDAIASLKS